jgi:hypothetical protein
VEYLEFQYFSISSAVLPGILPAIRDHLYVSKPQALECMREREREREKGGAPLANKIKHDHNKCLLVFWELKLRLLIVMILCSKIERSWSANTSRQFFGSRERERGEGNKKLEKLVFFFAPKPNPTVKVKQWVQDVWKKKDKE